MKMRKCEDEKMRKGGDNLQNLIMLWSLSDTTTSQLRPCVKAEPSARCDLQTG